MDTLTAHLDVQSPEHRPFATVELDHERLTIGRRPPPEAVTVPDVSLPDPEAFISRVHCRVEHENGQWYVVDNDSRNGTFRRRGGTIERVAGRVALADGDVICIVGLVGDDGEPLHWELHFSDPLGTRAAPLPRLVANACLRYDAAGGRLVVRTPDGTRPIPLSPQEHKLIRYMAEQNRDNADAPVLCFHEELMRAVWDDEPLHSQSDLNRLVWGIRKKLEAHVPDDLLENERGVGYRLRTCADG